jgi:hypothetical protein
MNINLVMGQVGTWLVEAMQEGGREGGRGREGEGEGERVLFKLKHLNFVLQLFG